MARAKKAQSIQVQEAYLLPRRTPTDRSLDIGIRASSTTHQHLLACIATEMRERRSFKVIDVGCGAERLIQYLRIALPAILPEAAIEVDGFDISDFAPHGNSNLGGETKTVKSGDAWPYSDRSVDVIISNQVIEHVFDPAFFFSEVARCLKPDGVSIHLGPFKNVIWEDHICIPLAHRITNPAYIRSMAWVIHRKRSLRERALQIPDGQTREFGECGTDYIRKYTRYMTHAETKHLIRNAGLTVSFDYTPRFYFAKLRSMTKRMPVYQYAKMRTFDNLSYWFARYVSSITLVLRHQAS